MSTVLTNGIIIPDNGSRNWGGDLANNWNILDVHVGYMNDVKNRVGTLENSVTTLENSVTTLENSVTTLENSVTTLENNVAENTANIQINASNISALQTSKQDNLSEQQIANIADVTNKANDADVVHKTGNEVISGVKTFSNDVRISKTSPFFNLFSSGYIKGQAPTSNIYSGVRFFDDINSGSANTITGGFEVEYNRDGYNKSYIASRNYAGENHKFFTVGLRVPNDDIRSVDFLPSVSDFVNLGTPTNKWKSFNGVEPSNLSLPSDTSITIDTTDFTWGRNFTFTPSVNGHLFINIDSTNNSIRSLSLKTGRGEYYFTNQTGIVRFTMPVYKGKIVTILVNSTVAETVIPSLSLFPCQGNV